MEGRGYLSESTPPHPLVHSFDMRDHWLTAEDPLYTRVDAADRVYWFLNEKKIPEPFAGQKLQDYIWQRDRGAGLGLPFAIEMVRRTGKPVGLVPVLSAERRWTSGIRRSRTKRGTRYAGL